MPILVLGRELICESISSETLSMNEGAHEKSERKIMCKRVQQKGERLRRINIHAWPRKLR